MDEVHGPDLVGCGSCATIVAQLRLHSSRTPRRRSFSGRALTGLLALMLPLRSDLKVAIAPVRAMFFGAIDIHYKIGIICLALGWATHSISSRLAKPHPVISDVDLLAALGISVMTGQQALAKIP